MANRILQSNPRIVGCTSMFEQHCASLALLRVIKEIADWAEASIDPGTGIPPVSHALSVVDLLEQAYEAYTGDPENRRIPDSQAAVISLLEQIPPDQRARMISLDYRIAHLTMLSRDIGTQGWNPMRQEMRRRVRAALEREGLDHVDFYVTGSSALAQDAVGHMVEDMLTSIFLAFGVILILMTILFRSLRVGLLSMIPNALPLLCTLSFIGYMGIPLRISTVIIFAMSLGIAVDDTIHFLARLREEGVF